jgi:protein SCO1/2
VRIANLSGIAVLLVLASVSTVIVLGAANPATTSETGAPFATNPSKLAPVPLVNQHGQIVDLKSLRGQYVLAAFIYTTCPGPCLVTTARMVGVASQLGDLIGKRLTLVSFTVDPEHDTPNRLLDYARAQGAERDGWLFLTGSPAQIDAVMAKFNLARERESDGLINHIVYLFLLGPDGGELATYDPVRDSPTAIAKSIRHTLAIPR